MSASLVSLASLGRAFDPVTPQLRVAAIITERRRVLLIEHRKRGQRYWVLPGGRVHAGETLAAALHRELREELSVAVQVGPLVIVSEMLAPDRHVVNLMFAATVGKGSEPRLDAADPVLAGWQWVAIDQLPRLDFRPPIAAEIQAAIAEQFSGPVRLVGDTWKPEPH